MEDGIKIVEKWIDVLNRKAIAEVGTVFAEEGMVHYPGLADAVGPQAIGALLASFFSAFPDLNCEITDIFHATDGRVVATFRTQATHSGPFLGIEATGHRINVEGIAIFTISNGKVTHEWNIDDVFSMTRQIGLLAV